MRILALEFSSSRRSVAVAEVSGEPAGRGPVRLLAAVQNSGGRETQAFALIQEALRKCGMDSDEIEGLVVGLGPGSYTGIRAAISVAQGWALARPVALAGIRSTDALCARILGLSPPGRFGVVVDAQRRDAYYQENVVSGGSWQVVRPLAIRPWGEVLSMAEAGVSLFGCDLPAPWGGVQELFPEAESLCQLAGQRFLKTTPEALEPVYLREISFVKAPPPRYT